MAVQQFQFVRRIFYARFSGSISQQDAERWLVKMHYHAIQSRQPIMAVMDMRHATYISIAARRIVVDASLNAHLFGVVLVTRSAALQETGRAICRMCRGELARVVPSLAEALQLAQDVIRSVEKQGTPQYAPDSAAQYAQLRHNIRQMLANSSAPPALPALPALPAPAAASA